MDLMNTYNNGLDKLDRFSSLLAGNKEKLTRTIVNAGLVVLILFVFGCFDFMTWKMDFTRILTPEYWTTIASKVVAAVSSFNIGINLNWETALSRAIELINQIKLYDLLIKQKGDDNFDYYVNHIFNPGIKRRAYINYINKKIHRLNRFSRDKDIALYSKKVPVGVLNYETLLNTLEQEKSVNKYCLRRKELEYLKSDEYINENIDSIGIKYTRVDPTLFDLEIDAKPIENNVVVKGNVALGKIKSSSSIIWTMVLISMFTTSIIISVNQQQFVDQMQAFWYYLLSCVVDAGLVIWNLFRGTRTAPRIISEQLTIPYTNRNKVLKGYISWKEENNKEPSKLFTKINKLIDENNNVVEMSEEEYLKTKNNNI